MAYTAKDGWVWAFVAIDHYTAEAWASVARRGVSCRHDWGPQYTSSHFTGSLRWLGIEDSPAYVGEPPCNGCAERFIRTLKEQLLWLQRFDGLDDLQRALADFKQRYNHYWRIERHGYLSPAQQRARLLASNQEAA